MEKQKNSMCILVQELLPVYFDECISDECKIAVEEHIKECKNCRIRLERTKADTIEVGVDLKEESESEIEEKQKFSIISKRLKHRRIRNLIILVSVMCIVLTTYINCFVSSTMASNSMFPTIEEQDNCLIFRYAYTFTNPKRGDIILANVDIGFDDTLCLSRVVGVPGDKIEIGNGRLYVNGEENSFYKGITAPIETSSITVAEDTYFLISDNFTSSYDSRYYGCVDIDSIYGKCIFHSNILKNPFVKTSTVTSTSQTR